MAKDTKMLKKMVRKDIATGKVTTKQAIRAAAKVEKARKEKKERLKELKADKKQLVSVMKKLKDPKKKSKIMIIIENTNNKIKSLEK